MTPSSTVMTFADPYEYQAAIRAGDVRFLVDRPGHYQAELTRIDLHQLWMQDGRSSLPQIAHVAIPVSRSPIFFLADTSQKPLHHTGMQLFPGDLIFTPPGSKNHQRMPAGAHWKGLSLAPDGLRAVVRGSVAADSAGTESGRIRDERRARADVPASDLGRLL